ncbi:IS200/IS605 family transposase [Sphingobacterium hungaricum]|uniref:Transposase n=1 Tax=Sphingobacterium hungaricum TaxID=2082723 RepID=A0A928V122_9SPHI|nr:IS200/IS605 family transposase [Sphingobacterium hungaricum]MBE8714714.1 transposase [Sphingobacterium hungaricum]
MSNTYSQINIHCVFAVKGRENIILDHFRDQLFKYMYGILKNDDIYVMAIGGWLDHVHVFFELPRSKRISDIVRDLKSTSSKWINDNRFIKGRFRWQEGYGAFSNSRSQRDRVIKYILNQETHHRKRSFKDEYFELMLNYKIDYNSDYLFEFYDFK